MPEMTLTEAASWAGKQRSKIFKAIKAGRLSARKDDGGRFSDRPRGGVARVFAPAGPGKGSRDGSGEQADTGGA